MQLVCAPVKTYPCSHLALMLPVGADRYSVIKTALGIAVAVVGISVVGVFLGRLVVGPLATWVAHDVDRPARAFSEQHDNSVLATIAQWVSSAGSAWIAGSVTVFVALVWWIRTRDPRIAMLLFASFVGAAFVTLVVKYGVHRSPDSEPTHGFTAGSFPSGHTLFAVAVYGTLAVAVLSRGRRWSLVRGVGALLLVGLSLGVGAGRVYLLDHPLSDVIGSLVLGVALVCATVAIVGPAGR